MQLVAIVVSLAIAVVGIALFVRAIRTIIGVAKMGQPARRTDHPVARTMTLVKESLGHTRMLQWTWVGAGHWFIMVGFGLLFFTLVTAFGQLFDAHFALPLIGHFFLWEWVSELFTFVMLIAIVAFIYYRATRPKERVRGPKGRLWGSTMWQGYFVEGVILGVGLCIVVLRGLEYALLTKGGEHADDANALHFPLSFGIGKAFEGMSVGTIENLIYLVAMLKIIISFAWMIVISLKPTMGVAWHRFLAFFNIYFRRHATGRTALGGLAPMMSNGKAIDFEDLEDMDEDTKLGVGAIEDFTWKGLLDFNTCTECGRCQSQCPAWNTEKPLSPKLLITALRDAAYAKAPYVQAAQTMSEGDREALLEGNTALALEVERPLVGDTGDDWFYNPESGAAVIDPEVLWNCTSCGACVQQCPVDIEHVDHIVDMRRYAVLVESNFPTELNGLFKGLENKGNPWNMSPNARLDWAKDLPFDVKVVGEDVESLDEVDWLFWVGCAGAYEDRAKKTTRAVAELLDLAGVDFAVLGNGETCTGDPARRAGNEFVFQGLATQNAELLKETKAKKVVSTCAHCFNTLKNEYAAFGVELEVVHHTQLLNRLVREKKLVPVSPTTARGPGARPPVSGPERQRTVTYHDPCYIGRHNGVYSPPRELLQVIPDADLVEMPRNSERSFCCGAGGARMWMEENTGERINLNRTKEAVETGADQIAVGCPFCRVMLSDGLTSQQSKGEAREEVEVLDVAQMLLASIKGDAPVAKKSALTASKASAPAEEPAHQAEAKAAGHADDAEATKAEPEAGDVTQSADTVTQTQDTGPLAKASGGTSLFDLGGDDEAEAPSSKAEPTPAAEAPTEAAGEDPAGDSTTDGETDRSQDDADTDVTPDPPAAPSSEPASGSAATPASEIPEGGSLFDLAEPTEESVDRPAATDTSTDEPAGEDPVADSTTDGQTDRSQDDADTDVTPAGETESESRSEPESDSGSTSGSGSPGASTTGAVAATAAAAGTAAAVRAVTPASEVPEGGSLFDLEEPAEEEVERPAAAATTQSDAGTDSATDTRTAEPAGEDPAGDSTTDGDTDRSQDDADSDVAPASTDSPTAPTASSSATTGGDEVPPGRKYPAGKSMFDLDLPADTRPAARENDGVEDPSEISPSTDNDSEVGTELGVSTGPDASADAGATTGTSPTNDGSAQTGATAAGSTDTTPTDETATAEAVEDEADAQGTGTTETAPDGGEQTAPTAGTAKVAGDGSSSDAPITSLRDIKAKFAGGSSSEGSSSNGGSAVTSTEDPDTEPVASTEAAATEAETESKVGSAGADQSEPDVSAEPKPDAEAETDATSKPAAGSGEAHQPKTDTEITETGSLFDL